MNKQDYPELQFEEVKKEKTDHEKIMELYAKINEKLDELIKARKSS